MDDDAVGSLLATLFCLSGSRSRHWTNNWFTARRVDHSRSMNGAVVCWLLVGLTADPSGVAGFFNEPRVGSALDGLPAAGSMNGGLVC